jgi:hypothetical protein
MGLRYLLKHPDWEEHNGQEQGDVQLRVKKSPGMNEFLHMNRNGVNNWLMESVQGSASAELDEGVRTTDHGPVHLHGVPLPAACQGSQQNQKWLKESAQGSAPAEIDGVCTIGHGPLQCHVHDVPRPMPLPAA